VQNLIVVGSPTQISAQLQVMLQYASSQVDQYCYQRLYAEQVTETAEARPDPYGRLQVRCRQFPITSVAGVPAYLQAQWRQGSQQGWSQIPAANVTVVGALQHQYVADDRDYGPYGGWGLAPITVQTTYVHGYPNALLTSAAAAGATSIAVDDATGMQAGTVLTVWDATGGGQEQVTVASVSGNIVTLTAALQYGHAAGVRVSALPYAVSQACILIAAWQIKERRAGGAIVMGPGALQPVNLNTDMDMEAVRLLLQPFRRVV
jgi:hypothetical protein